MDEEHTRGKKNSFVFPGNGICLFIYCIMYLMYASYNYTIYSFLFMCFFIIYFIVYSSYSKFIAKYDVDIHT